MLLLSSSLMLNNKQFSVWGKTPCNYTDLHCVQFVNKTGLFHLLAINSVFTHKFREKMALGIKSFVVTPRCQTIGRTDVLYKVIGGKVQLHLSQDLDL